MSPWLALGILLFWLGSLTTVGFWQNHAGHTAEREVWQEKETQELAEAATKTKELEDSYRAQEQQWTSKLNSVSANYERKLKDANDKFKAVSATVDHGSFRLLDAGAQAVCPGAGVATEVAAAPSGHHDTAAGCELSSTTSGSLWQLAQDADGIAERLRACQQIILDERQ